VKDEARERLVMALEEAEEAVMEALYAEQELKDRLHRAQRKTSCAMVDRDSLRLDLRAYDKVFSKK